MDELRDQLFSGAALAGDEDRRIGGSHASGQIDRSAERRRGAEHRDALAVAVFASKLRLDGVRLPPHEDAMRGTAEQDLQVRAGEGLGEIVPGSRAQGLETRVQGGIAGHHDDNRVRMRLEAHPQQTHPGYVPHVQIEEHNVEPVALEHVARFIPATRQADLIAFVPKHRRAAFPQRPLVVHNEYVNAGLELRRERQEAHHVPWWSGRALARP